MSAFGEKKGPFYHWALEHGYYKENPKNKRFEDGYDDCLGCDPPFDEYAESGPGVKKKEVNL